MSTETSKAAPENPAPAEARAAPAAGGIVRSRTVPPAGVTAAPAATPSPPALPPAAAQTQGWLQALRARLGMTGQQTLRDTIEDALRDEDRTEQAFSAEERAMLLRLLRFGASRVVDIMVPRADIIALDEGEPLSELLRTFEEAGVSRIPLFHDTLDDPL